MVVNFPHCNELPPHVSGEIQTRSEETGLTQHPSLMAAVKAAWEDKTIWKLSYQTPAGWKRIVIR